MCHDWREAQRGALKSVIARPDVDELLGGELGQWLEGQALVREEARAKSNTRLVIAAFIVLPIGAFLLFGPAISGMLKTWLIIAMTMGASWWVYSPRAKAIRQTKQGINNALARALGLEYAHDTNPSIGFARAHSFHMLPGFDRSHYEDMWSGEIGGRRFTLHEAVLKQRRSSGKNTRYVTVFRGPVMTISSDREFHGITLLERAGKHRNFLFFGEKDSLTVGGRELRKVDMVHPEFEDEFTIYATDQTEAHYLVHPTYVEKLIELERAFAGKKIRTLMMDGEITVVLEARNMFESGNMDAGRDREMIETCINQFMSMADLASALNQSGRG